MGDKGKPLRNVGIFAHVDAGKTTTTEQMLFVSGAIRELGSVDTGTAQTDWLDIERQRGISVKSAVTRFHWNNIEINLVDTPGHYDFLAEVERSLRVMDGAILIISAVEGVQSQTELIWHALQKLQVPTLIFINKMNRVGAEPLRVLKEIQTLLSPHIVPIQAPVGQEEEFSTAHDLLKETHSVDGTSEYEIFLMEGAAEIDDHLMEVYFEKGHLASEEMEPILNKAVPTCNLYPVLFGAANKGLGIKELLNAITTYIPSPQGTDEDTLSGVVFKIDKDPNMGRITFIRLYQGVIQNRDTIFNYTRHQEEKVTQIRKITGQKSEDVGILHAGELGAVYGLTETKIGDIIGSPEAVPHYERLAIPLLSVQVHWDSSVSDAAVVTSFQELADEDPLLDVEWLRDQRELHIKVMGPIQMEVLSTMVQSRFGFNIKFDEPSVIYRETPAMSGEGFIAYTMPKPCWAILRFKIEPGERGSGIEYSAQVRTEDLLERYQKEVEKRIPEALKQGLKGWEVTDLKITLVEGQHHVYHTHPLDFVVATPMGIMNGLVNTGTKLLEPILEFRMSVPEEDSGKVMNEITLMRGSFETPKSEKGRLEITGTLPVATSLDFPVRFSSMTKGRGILSTKFLDYEEAPVDVHAERQRIGVNPLDQAKYILATRNAISSH